MYDDECREIMVTASPHMDVTDALRHATGVSQLWLLVYVCRPYTKRSQCLRSAYGKQCLN